MAKLIYTHTVLSITYTFIWQVQRKQKGIVRARGDLEEYDDRIHAMSEHLKNVRQELNHTQVFLLLILI